MAATIVASSDALVLAAGVDVDVIHMFLFLWLYIIDGLGVGFRDGVARA